jgi:hypothetical protein
VSPFPLWRKIGLRGGPVALRASQRPATMRDANLDLPILNGQIHSIHAPSHVQAQQPSVMFGKFANDDNLSKTGHEGRPLPLTSIKNQKKKRCG